MNFYIFRHGDTSQSKNPLSKIVHHSDTHNLPILPDGVNALKKEGEFLKNIKTGANFCSPYLRCRESAKIVSEKSNKDFKTDSRLGELEGKESFNHFKNRVESFLDEIKKKNYESVAICTHGAVIAAIKHIKKDNKFYFFQVFDYPRPGVLTEIKNGKITTRNFN